jgi:hypothetical protein
MAEYHDRHTMERMREQLARANNELGTPNTSSILDLPRESRWT